MFSFPLAIHGKEYQDSLVLIVTIFLSLSVSRVISNNSTNYKVHYVALYSSFYDEEGLKLEVFVGEYGSFPCPKL